jgi:hypothetical protein
MFQDIMDELRFFPLVFNFDICGFDIYGTLVARNNRICGGIPVLAYRTRALNLRRFIAQFLCVTPQKVDNVKMATLWVAVSRSRVQVY